MNVKSAENEIVIFVKARETSSNENVMKAIVNIYSHTHTHIHTLTHTH